MKRLLVYGLLAACGGMMTACTSEELPVPQPESAESAAPFKPGEIIVKFRPEASDQLDRLPMATRGGTATRSGMVPVRRLAPIR